MAPPNAPTLSEDIGNAQSFATKSVQVLVAEGVKEVPSMFIQPSEYRPNTEEAFHCTAEIPVIDMNGLAGDEKMSTLAKLAKACEDWGFFQVINHGVDEKMLQSIREVTREFFKLPMATKEKWAMKPGTLIGYGRFNTAHESVTEWVDILTQYLYPESLRDDSLLPTEPPAYREVTTAYGQEIKRFVNRLTVAVSESLGLEPDDIVKISGEFAAALRLNYYPPCPQPDRVLGVGSHSDGGMLTVLIEDGGSGLQVRSKDGHWASVKGVPNALIVNIADMLQVISNGKYRSADHRALVNQSTERYSIVCFSTPQLDAIIHPAEQLLSETNPARYRAVSYKDYFKYYFKNKAHGKARVESLLIKQQQ